MNKNLCVAETRCCCCSFNAAFVRNDATRRRFTLQRTRFHETGSVGTSLIRRGPVEGQQRRSGPAAAETAAAETLKPTVAALKFTSFGEPSGSGGASGLERNREEQGRGEEKSPARWPKGSKNKRRSGAVAPSPSHAPCQRQQKMRAVFIKATPRALLNKSGGFMSRQPRKERCFWM